MAPVDQFDKYIQDALDLIEFANGPATSRTIVLSNSDLQAENSLEQNAPLVPHRVQIDPRPRLW